MPLRKLRAFSAYQITVLLLLTLVRFVVLLDFIMMSPLNPIVSKALSLGPGQFSQLISTYAFSAGIGGLLLAGFADRFDRKTLLLFVFVGFLIGTSLCGMATDFSLLLGARIVTGFFGGIAGATSLAIFTDLFQSELRGRVMGYMQMVVSVVQILGIPVVIYLAHHLDWQMPFVLITVLGGLVVVALFVYLKPVDAHLTLAAVERPFQHLGRIVTRRSYLLAFLGAILVSADGWMLQVFDSAFIVNNLGVRMEDLPMLFGLVGGLGFLLSPLFGYLCDRVGIWETYLIGSLVFIGFIISYTSQGRIPYLAIIFFKVIAIAALLGKGIAWKTLVTNVPKPEDRGAFMCVTTSFERFAGGTGALVAGLIVKQAEDGTVIHFDRLGLLVALIVVLAMVVVYLVNKRFGQPRRGQVLD